MIGMSSAIPQNSWPSSTSAGSIVSVPGGRDTYSKPYVGRRSSTFERKTRRLAEALAVWSSTGGLLAAVAGILADRCGRRWLSVGVDRLRDPMQLLEMHHVMHAREQQPLAAAQSADQRVIEQARVGLVAGDLARRTGDDPLALEDLSDELGAGRPDRTWDARHDGRGVGGPATGGGR